MLDGKTKYRKGCVETMNNRIRQQAKALACRQNPPWLGALRGEDGRLYAVLIPNGEGEAYEAKYGDRLTILYGKRRNKRD